MKVEYINPFLTSVNTAFETLIDILPLQEALFIKQQAVAGGDVTGIIGFVEKKVSGSVAISFPLDTALLIHNLMLGETVNRLTPGVQDTVGEIANIIAGGAKTEFAGMGLSFHISIPTIVAGKNHSINHNVGLPTVVIPFKLHDHHFTLEVCMKVEE
ncbi:MAG: chemotaxis protein CheX [FCB group bacterium]|nr:chemotaxis protein CheX [FCB group bacterium]